MRQRTRFAWFIDRARTGHHPNARKLEHKFSVSSSTARRDIDVLRGDLGAPLKYRRSLRGYDLTDRDWKLPTEATPGEIAVAIAGARALLARVDVQLAGRLDALVARLPEIPVAGAQLRALEVSSTRTHLVDDDVLLPLLEASAAQRRVRFLYLSPWQSGEARWREVSPWFVHHHDDHLYLHGQCHESQEGRVFSLAGMSKLERLTVLAKREPRDARSRLERSMGVGTGEPRWATVVLRGHWAKWVKSEIWHSSQEDRWLNTDTSAPALERRFRFELEDEVVRRLMAGGGDIEVRSPLSLRRALQLAFAAGAERNEIESTRDSSWAASKD